MEIKVSQRSDEWFRLRSSLMLTASRFGDAIGVGLGKPYDFLVSLISGDSTYDSSDVTPEQRHGITLEPVIDEAYQILTGHVTQKSGLWIPDEDDLLHGISGASPDAKVYHAGDPGRLLGLAEYKSPVYGLYSSETHPPYGIPRRYMAQIQGQMAISKQPWCDFMAVCSQTKDIMLRRVYFNNTYWNSIARVIKDFCDILKEALDREAEGLDQFSFSGARSLKLLSIREALYPGEKDITTENLLWRNASGCYKTCRGTFSYDLLMGNC